MVSNVHIPVLLDEALAALTVRGDGVYVDATFGRGGHSGALLATLNDRGRVIALDRDPQAIAAGRAKFAGESRLTLIHCVFADIGAAVREQVGMGGLVNGVLFDLGVSSPQLDDAARGFSFMQDGPLDMRMDNSASSTSDKTAAQYLASVSERELVRVLREYGEERFAKRIAGAIVNARRESPITGTGQLAALVADAVPTREPGKHPATRTFQAIRIAVNDELRQIESALKQTLDLLAVGGRLAVISFHSLEDRLVKQFMQRNSQEDPVYAGLPSVPEHARPKLKRVGRAIHTSEAEASRNPRARSAILRVAERVAA